MTSWGKEFLLGVVYCGLGLAVLAGLALYMTRRAAGALSRVVLVASGLLCFGLSAAAWHEVIDRQDVVWHERAHVWGELPLQLWYDPTIGGVYAPTFADAVALWNKRAGCKLFTVTPQKADADVVVEPYIGEKCSNPLAFDTTAGSLAHTVFCASGDVTIQLRTLDHVGQVFRLFVHELGHVLGLADDSVGVGGAMGPVSVPRQGDSPEYSRVSSKDLGAVAGRYCAD